MLRRLPPLTFWLAVHLAKHFQLLAHAPVLLILAVSSPLPTWILPMQSTQLALFEESSPPSSYGKMSLAYSAPKTMPSDAFWERLPAKAANYNHQGGNGQTLVVCLAPKEQSRGGSSMPNISAWPNDAVVCSLWQVLEKGSIPQRYFLSSKACAGILRRAERRGKELPMTLHRALQAVAEGLSEQVMPEGKTQ